MGSGTTEMGSAPCRAATPPRPKLVRRTRAAFPACRPHPRHGVATRCRIGARPVIRTPVCDLLGITVPVVAAPFGPWEQVDLAAAVSRAGGLGSPGTPPRPPPQPPTHWRAPR